MVLNIWGVRLLPLINKAAITWSLAGAATICIVCLACASGNYQSGSFVFGKYINETGWNGGVAWVRILGPDLQRPDKLMRSMRYARSWDCCSPRSDSRRTMPSRTWLKRCADDA